MNIKERINWLFVRVLFALQLSYRLGVLGGVTVLVLAMVYLGYKTGISYEPTTKELFRNMLSNMNVLAEHPSLAEIFSKGSFFVLIIAFVIKLEFLDWWEGAVKNLIELGKSAKIFLTRGASFTKCMLSLWKFSKSVLVVTVLVGSGNSIIMKEDPCPIVKRPCPIVKQLLVPFSNHVHFENAKFEGNRLVKGVTLGSAREASMLQMLKGLEHCGDANTPVKIKLYGFASNDKFRGYTQLESEIRNLKAANKRASNVHSVLNKLLQESFDSRDWIQLEDPKPWPEPQALDASLETSLEMCEMKKKRFDLIKVMGNDTTIRDNPCNDTTMRDPLADRAVVLDLVDPGMCNVMRPH